MSKKVVIDDIISGRRMRKVFFEVSNGKFEELESLICDIKDINKYDFSDVAVTRLATLMRFLIDCKLYGYLLEMLNDCSWIVALEDGLCDGEECVLSYAIRMIKDNECMMNLINTCKDNYMAWVGYKYEYPVLIAIKLGRYELIPKLFDMELCMEKYACGDCTILQYAAENKDYELAEMALDKLGHNPDLYNRFNEVPPISIAVQKNDFDMVTLLLSYGADINATDGDGKSVLSYSNTDEMHDFLVKNGAKDSDPNLILLCKGIRSLKTKGVISPEMLNDILFAELCDFSYGKDNLVVLAARYGDARSLMKLCRFSKTEEMNAELLKAVFGDYTLYNTEYRKSVKKLIELTDILIANNIKFHHKFYFTDPFFNLTGLAQEFNCVDEKLCFELFNKIHILGFEQDEDSLHNLLSSAVNDCNIPVIKYCLKKHVHYSKLNTDTESAVEILFDDSFCSNYKKEHPEIVESILLDMFSSGCDTNHTDAKGRTVLHKLAAKSDAESAIRMAIRYGADPMVKDDCGMTPYDIAVENGMPKAVIDSLRYMY